MPLYLPNPVGSGTKSSSHVLSNNKPTTISSFLVPAAVLVHRVLEFHVSAGKMVSGRPASELTSGEEGGGEDAGEDVDIAGGGVDAGYCWLERRYLCLACLGLGFGLR